MVTLWPDDELGAVIPEEPELVEVPEEVPEELPEDEVDVDVVRLDVADVWTVAGVAAWGEPDAARTAVPPVSARATPAIPAVILLTRRRACCRRVTASLGLGRAW